MTIKPHEINVGDVLEKKEILVRYVVTKISLDFKICRHYTFQVMPEYGHASMESGTRIWVMPEYTYSERDFAELNLVKIKSLGENDD